MTHWSEEYRRGLAEAARFIREHDDFLVVSHVHPDGDAAGSTCAMGWILEQCGKRYRMINESPMPGRFRYLWGWERIDRYEPGDPFRPAAAICVDCADFARIGAVRSMIGEPADVLNIDHHPTNDRYGTVHLVKDNASATAEILYDLIGEMGLSWDRSAAECIYTGLLTDTGGFRYSNTTPRVMDIASELLTFGISPGEIAGMALETISLAHIRLLHRALSTLSFTEDRRIAWMCATKKDIEETGASSEDMEGLVNYPRNIEGVDVGILFKQLGETEVKISFRANGHADVSLLARRFGGGGHVRAAGATVQGELDSVVRQVIAAAREALT